MANWFTKILDFVKRLVTRPGLDRFLAQYMSAAVALLVDLAGVNSNTDFHVWKDKAFAELKRLTGETRDNWISLLIGFAFEELKARGAWPK